MVFKNSGSILELGTKIAETELSKNPTTASSTISDVTNFHHSVEKMHLKIFYRNKHNYTFTDKKMSNSQFFPSAFLQPVAVFEGKLEKNKCQKKIFK